MLSDKGGRTIKEFVAAFRDMGYNCHYEVINTKDYGVPQNRERVFIVGFKDVEHYYNFSFAPKIKLIKRLKDILEKDVDEKYYLSDKQYESLLNPKYESMGMDRVNDEDGYCNCLTTMTGGNREPKIKIKKVGFINQDTQGSAVYSEHGLCPTLCSGTHGYAQGYIEVKQGTKKGFDIALPGDSINMSFPSSLTRRGRVGKQVSQTLDCACSITTVEEDFRIRKLTPRECFRLQDFPDTFKFVVSNSQLYKQAGNSISVNVIEMIFNQIEKSRNGNTNQGSLF
jgi:DNA (cytosine-5)-methyltransferase 1